MEVLVVCFLEYHELQNFPESDFKLGLAFQTRINEMI